MSVPLPSPMLGQPEAIKELVQLGQASQAAGVKATVETWIAQFDALVSILPPRSHHPHTEAPSRRDISLADVCIGRIVGEACRMDQAPRSGELASAPAAVQSSSTRRSYDFPVGMIDAQISGLPFQVLLSYPFL